MPYREGEVQYLRAQLRDIGVEVVPEFAAAASLFGILKVGDFDLALFAWTGGADPGGSVDIFRCGGPQNFTGYCNRQVSQDLLQSDRILDPARRAALLNRVDAQLARDMPALPLFQWAFPVGVRATIRGVVPNDVPDFLTWNSENWWLEAQP